MNLRCTIKAYVKPVLCMLLVFLLAACFEDEGKSGTTVIVQSSDKDKDEEKDAGGKKDEGGEGGNAGTSYSSIVAVHKPSSPQYNDKCLDCHGDIPTQLSLDSNILNAHVHMLQFTPGEDSKRCTWCHRDVSGNLIQTAAITGPFAANVRKTIDSQLCAICHGPVGPGKPFYQNGLTASANPDGPALYHYLCSSCHRQLANSEVKGESVQEIYNNITTNEGGMGALSVLNPTWIQAIASALGGDTTLPPDIPGTGTGDALYQQYCSSCHGQLASSTKAGASVTQINNAINGGIPQMTTLNFLTAAQIQLIAEALAGSGGTGGGGTGGGGSIDGAALYTANCSGCHGPLSTSAKTGASANQIQNGVNNVNEMSGLSFLTTAQIQAISDALNGIGGGGSGGGGTVPTDGAGLYLTYCASCHADLNNSQVSSASARQINEAIAKNEGGVMGGLSFLTNEQIQLIADALTPLKDSDGEEDE